MSIISSMDYASQAMGVHAWGMATAAHNVANVNTAGFNPQHAVYATGPDGWGVQLDAILQDADALGRQPAEPRSRAMVNASSVVAPETTSPSGTDLSREMVHMISYQRGYQANAQVVRTADGMLGYLLDMKA